jgi:hypothetical protein
MAMPFFLSSWTSASRTRRSNPSSGSTPLGLILSLTRDSA